MKKLFLLSALLLTGCSNLTKNYVKDGKFHVKSGTAYEKVWNDKLVFDRTSWYHELTMQFDLLTVDLKPTSPFYNWLSKNEQEQASKCRDFKIGLAYSLDTVILPYSHLNAQLEEAGFQKIELIEFKKQLVQHPDSEMYSLNLYKVFGMCRAISSSKPLILNFPGYTEKVLPQLNN